MDNNLQQWHSCVTERHQFAVGNIIVEVLHADSLCTTGLIATSYTMHQYNRQHCLCWLPHDAIVKDHCALTERYK